MTEEYPIVEAEPTDAEVNAEIIHGVIQHRAMSTHACPTCGDVHLPPDESNTQLEQAWSKVTVEKARADAAEQVVRDSFTIPAEVEVRRLRDAITTLADHAPSAGNRIILVSFDALRAVLDGGSTEGRQG